MWSIPELYEGARTIGSCERIVTCGLLEWNNEGHGAPSGWPLD